MGRKVSCFVAAQILKSSSLAKNINLSLFQLRVQKELIFDNVEVTVV